MEVTLKENCFNPTLTTKKYLGHLLVRVREKRKGAEKDINKGQNKEWREKVDKWVDGNCKETSNLMKMGEKGNAHHSVSKGRIPNSLEEVEEAEKYGRVGGTRKGAKMCRNV